MRLKGVAMTEELVPIDSKATHWIAAQKKKPAALRRVSSWIVRFSASPDPKGKVAKVSHAPREFLDFLETRGFRKLGYFRATHLRYLEYEVFVNQDGSVALYVLAGTYGVAWPQTYYFFSITSLGRGVMTSSEMGLLESTSEMSFLETRGSVVSDLNLHLDWLKSACVDDVFPITTQSLEDLLQTQHFYVRFLMPTERTRASLGFLVVMSILFSIYIAIM